MEKVTVLDVKDTLYQPGYWSQGVLSMNVTVGMPVMMDRVTRAPQSPEEIGAQQVLGHFMSSPVARIEAPVADGSVLVHTRNSIWRVQPIATP